MMFCKNCGANWGSNTTQGTDFLQTASLTSCPLCQSRPPVAPGKRQEEEELHNSLIDGSEDSESLFHLGLNYEMGRGTDKNLPKAVEYYLQSAAEGNTSAQFQLALCYRSGKGVEVDKVASAKWAKEAVDQANFPPALVLLGYCYLEGEGVPQDQERAFALFTAGVEEDEEEEDGWFHLARCYHHGFGTKKDMDKAVECYTQGEQLGNHNCSFHLGLLYHLDLMDKEKSLIHFGKGAMGGHKAATNFLARMYSTGDGVEKDLRKAFLLQTQNVMLNDNQAMLSQADSFRRGLGVAANPYAALDLYQRASAENFIAKSLVIELKSLMTGDLPYLQRTSCHSSAEEKNYFISLAYEQGRGCEASNEEAFFYLTESAKAGYAPAQNKVALYWIKGEIVKEDKVVGANWYQKAATQGDSNAQLNLGACYEVGCGVAQNFQTAVHWYEKGAAQDNAMAQYHLAMCLRSGLGVTKDLKKAKDLFQRSAMQGYDQAQYLLSHWDSGEN